MYSGNYILVMTKAIVFGKIGSANLEIDYIVLFWTPDLLDGVHSNRLCPLVRPLARPLVGL